MKKIFTYIFSKLPFVRELSGYKTYIGAFIILVYYVNVGIVDILLMFPDISVLAKIQSLLSLILPHLDTLAQTIGIPLTVFGVAHDKAKREI